MNVFEIDYNGRMPFVLNDLRFLDSIFREAIISFAKGLGNEQNYIITGIAINQTSGDYYNAIGGYIFYNDELLSVADTSIEIPIGYKAVIRRVESYDAEGQKLYGDGVVRSTYKLIQGEFIVVANSSNDFFELDTVRLSSIYKENFSEKSAFNKDFGITPGSVPPIGLHGLGYAGAYGIVMYDGPDGGLGSIPIKSAFNQNFGSGNSDVEKGSNNPNQLITKVLEIGPWNMQSTPEIDISHTIPNFLKIVNVTAIIVNDEHWLLKPETRYADFGVLWINSLVIRLFRKTGGLYDNILYSSTSINRGYVKVEYLPDT